MASKRPGEIYRGNALHVPLSQDGQVSAYVWPLRVLEIRGEGVGGPTIGVDVSNEEILRFDCHDKPGHWHSGGYDKLGSPGNSHVDFPKEVNEVDVQVDWALSTISDSGRELLEQAGHSAAAQSLDPDLVQSAVVAIKTHLAKAGNLRSQALAEKLITA